MSLPLMRALRVHVAELIGTFALVFVGCGTIAVGKVDALGVALAFGITIGVMWYAVGHISGGQFNPAVSIGLARAATIVPSRFRRSGSRGRTPFR
jgi:glycerol uptake facilitator-like aquaporin